VVFLELPQKAVLLSAPWSKITEPHFCRALISLLRENYAYAGLSRDELRAKCYQAADGLDPSRPG